MAATRRGLSLRTSLTLITGAVVALVLGLSSYVLVHWVRASQLDDADHLLNDKVNAVAAAAKFNIFFPIPSGFETGQVEVVGPDGVSLRHTPGLADQVRLNVFEAPKLGQQEAHTVTAERLHAPGHDRYRVMARTVRVPPDYVTIYAASSLRPADQVVRSLKIALWSSIPALIALAALATWFLTGRALRPVDEMRRQLDNVQSAGEERRLSPSGRAAELDRLTETLNQMLDRLNESDMIRRQFLADASHELRSPLASARTMLEVGLQYPELADWPETAADVMVEVQRLQEIAVELLALARAEGGERALQREVVELGALVREEVQRAGDDRVALSIATVANVSVDKALVVRLLRNLLDNARRHAQSRVTVNVAGRIPGSDGQHATVQVHNDGDEIPVDQREKIFEPFTRLDNARARDEGGAGLGLSIARRIAEVHGGTLAVVDTARGAAFLLTMPLAGAPEAAPKAEPAATLEPQSEAQIEPATS
jgi:signal transduction histidine kinase